MSHSTYVTPPAPAEMLSRLSGKINVAMQKAKEGTAKGSRDSIATHHTAKSFSDEKGVSGLGDVKGPVEENFSGSGKASEIMDFSYILKQVVNYPSEAEKKLEALLNRIDERPVYTRKTREELNRLVNQINEYINDTTMDVDDVITMIEDRVNIYLENQDITNELTLDEMQQEYIVLVDMLDMEGEMPRVEDIPMDELENVIEQLKNQAVVVEQQVYTAEIMQEVFESLGLTVEEFAVLDEIMEGEVYGFDDDPAMKVFVAYQSGTFVFEPVVDDEAMTETIANKEDKASAVAEELKKPCELHERIMREAAKRGLAIYMSNEEPPTPDSVATTSDLSDRTRIVSSTGRKEDRNEEARKKRYRDTSQKVRTID